jgi:hypothetical protein
MTDDTKALIAEAHLSWNGFNVSGDRKSIDEVTRLVQTDGTNDALRARIRALTTALTEAEARAERRYAVLKAVEWIASDDWDFCPVCARTQQSGHEADCALAAALIPPPAGEKPHQEEPAR